LRVKQKIKLKNKMIFGDANLKYKYSITVYGVKLMGLKMFQ